MAQKKKPAARSGAKTTRSRSRRSQPDVAQSWSILLFGLGIVLIAMALVAGQSVWAMLRGVLFGVFGVCTYLLGPVLLYIAVLVALGRPIWARCAKSLLLMMLICGTAVVFSKIDLVGLSFGETTAALYANGQGILGGGLLGGIIGGTLLALCGHPAANILLVILLIAMIMWYMGVTPGDLWQIAEDYLGDWRADRDAARQQREAWEEEQLRREPERRAAAQERAAARQQKQEAFAQRFRKKPQVDIDLGPDPVVATEIEPQPEEPLVGPGGTFGMYPPMDSSEPSEPSEFETEIPMEEPQSDPDVGFEPYPSSSPDYAWEMRFDDAPESSDADEPPFQLDQPIPLDLEQPATGGTELDSLIHKAMEPSQTMGNSYGEPLRPLNPAAAPAETAPAEPTEQPAAYRYPPLDLFQVMESAEDPGVEAELKKNAELLVSTLESFGVKTRVLDICRGPSVTRYELQPLAGVKISRITGLADDIALNLAAAGVRIEAPIPGKPAVGVEVPNRKSSPVGIRGIFESQAYTRSASPLTLALGKDIAGNAQVADLCKMPHLLIAGSTGSGKSVCVNSIIISFLYRSSPEDVKLILIDPKVVELAEYNGIPHLLMPVVTEPRKAAGALGSAVAEMERRYHLFAENNVRDIKSFNRMAAETDGMEKLPYIAIIIDELADLMMVAGKEVEDYICRIAQKARAAGMHLIVATQRPSVDVITGLIKANIPSRIAFAVSSQVDSRTILDAGGAEKLLGMGDMLFMPVGASKPLRIQGTYVKDEEISTVLDFIKKDNTSQYDEKMIEEMEKHAVPEKASGGDGDDEDDGHDPMLEQAVEVVIDAGQASTSLLQRKCKLGYARAARIMDDMEQLGVIGPYQGAKPREVLITRQQWIERSMRADNAPVPEEIP